MNYKEKAEELVGMFDGNKQCALICVDEMLKLLWHTHKNETEYRDYQQVKQEIQKL